MLLSDITRLVLIIAIAHTAIVSMMTMRFSQPMSDFVSSFGDPKTVEWMETSEIAKRGLKYGHYYHLENGTEVLECVSCFDWTQSIFNNPPCSLRMYTAKEGDRYGQVHSASIFIGTKLKRILSQCEHIFSYYYTGFLVVAGIIMICTPELRACLLGLNNYHALADPRSHAF